MGRLFVTHLEGQIYTCKHCRTHLALYEDIVSKAFHSRHGRAYLFSKETAHEKSQKYKEGKSVIERYKVSGPDGNNNNNYWVGNEAHVGGSDADDA
ncbi:hypothetical protein JHK86_039101 [Glycine max]|nr:hypothetical protein JHK86_039101 [Glycine max]